ncbi:MAG: MMPL family transporter [Solobacterium sp.]|nr:MMPL family transporter [Solobacterium sp.]
MKTFSEKIVRSRIVNLILAVLLLIPAGIGYIKTKVNYDLLTYLPKDIETMTGQDILIDEFGTGGFSMYIVEGMPQKDVVSLKEKIKNVEGVKDVIWYDSALDITIPMEILPDSVYETFNSDDSTMMFILFEDSTSADLTISAVEDIRKISNEQCFLSGMSAVLVDTRDLSESEAPVYVGIAVLLSVIVLMLAMDSWLIPFIFLASIGMAIIYNLGSNIFLGQISYVTKALAAVLQLGVTMDYSIFLWHAYIARLKTTPDKEEAMCGAIEETMTSIVGSSITTIAGFIALCFMSFTLGLDLGIVMAKGVIFGVISCVTILPSMILTFDGLLRKTSHKALLPDLHRIGDHVVKHSKIYLVVMLLLLGPAIYGYTHTNVYYNLDSTLPRDLPSIIANEKLDQQFNTSATHALLISSDVPEKDIRQMSSEMKKEDGVKWVLGFNTIKGTAIPDVFIPEQLSDALISDHWQLILIGSEYQVASNEVNQQIEKLQGICKRYDDKAMLIGEAPATKDLINITATDFATVSVVSIGVIFLIIALVFRSISLPVILVAVIEFGIFINMGIPAFTGTKLPFVASIVIGTIQLGSTVDYAILLTTRYRRDRTKGIEKHKAVSDAVKASAKSILVSAMSFFAATFGVGLYSNIDMISSLCTLMARGALISMICVIFILPSILLMADGIITKTSKPQRG